MTDEMKYSDALSEIETIVEEIEAETVDVDILTEKVKRAAFLIKYCKGKLKKTDDQVKMVLKEFESGDE